MNTTHGHQPARREYRSELRAAQAKATRERILSAVTSLIRGDTSQVSIAGIARAARVSLPTVHRHFPTRRDLFEAYRLHMEGARHDAVAEAHPPATIAEAAPMIRRFFQRFDDAGDPIGTMRRLRPSVAWEFSREVTVPRRRAWAERIVDAEFPGLPPEDRTRFCDLVVVLVSASMGEAMRGYLDLPVRTMADRVVWAIDALAAHARTRARRSSRDMTKIASGEARTPRRKGSR